jgi:hypothetical protein
MKTLEGHFHLEGSAVGRSSRILFGSMVFLAFAGGFAFSESPSYAPGELLVKFKDSASHSRRAACLSGLQGEVMRRYDMGLRRAHMDRFFSGGLLRIKLPENVNVIALASLLSKLDIVEYAEPNWRTVRCAIPDDTQYGTQWGHGVIDSESAWDIRTEAKTAAGVDIVVGVIDTGCDYLHEDLTDNIWTNSGEMGDDGMAGQKETNGLDDDGNGYVDDWRGWDFLWADNDPMSEGSGIMDHSSHCSGIIGARGDNATGVCGVCWRVKIMILKFEDVDDTGTVADAIEAIQYAASFNVRILSNSYGIMGGKSQALEDAITASGTLFVAAAGNSNWDNDQSPFYPTNLACDNLVSVAASTSADVLASFTCWGRHSVDLAAPGHQVLSTTLGDTYTSYSGTSMSAPFVAGAAALVLAHYPSLTNAQLKHKILASTELIAACAGKMTSNGRLNLLRALQPVVGTPALVDPGILDNDGDYTLSWSTAAEAVRYEVQEGRVETTSLEDVEAVGGPWIMTGFTRSTAAAHGGTYAYFSGNTNNLRNTLEFHKPVLVLSGGKVSYWTSYNTETDWDYCFFQVSEDNGHHWTTLKIYNGPLTSWLASEINLSAYEGKVVLLRFRYYTDGAGANGGCYVDDIELTNLEHADWTALTTTETGTSYPIVGNGDGTYRYRVRAFDTNDIYGMWSDVEDMEVYTGALSVDTTSLADAMTGTAYSQTLLARGGSGAYTWSLSVGVLPGGLSLLAGVISGTPDAGSDGTYDITVQVTDALSATATQALTLKVDAPPPPLVIETVSLPPGTEAVSYTEQLVSSGGTAPVVWSLASGRMPDGLNLYATGEVSGVPVIAGDYTFTVLCSDADLTAVTQELTIHVMEKSEKDGCSCAPGAGSTHPAYILGCILPYLVFCAAVLLARRRRRGEI